MRRSTSVGDARTGRGYLLTLLLCSLSLLFTPDSARAQGAIIVTVDGLNFDEFWYPFSDLFDTEEYLASALKSINLGVPDNDILSISWPRDSYYTYQAVNKVRSDLKTIIDQRAIPEGKKLIIVSHSWGTFLAYMALYSSAKYDLDPIHCDLFITLGSPLGADNVGGGLFNPVLPLVDFTLMTAVSSYRDLWLAMLKYDRSSEKFRPRVDRAVNYWVFGDAISGKLSNFKFNPAIVEDIEWKSDSRWFGRSLGTNNYHKYDSLQTGGSPDNSDARTAVKNLILQTIADNSAPSIITCLQLSESPNTNFSCRFSEKIDESTINTSNITISGSVSGNHPWTYFYSEGTLKLTLNLPFTNFEYGEKVTLNFNTGIKDLSGNNLARQQNFNFDIMKPADPGIDIVLFEPDGENDTSYYSYYLTYKVRSSSNVGMIDFYYDTNGNLTGDTPASNFMGKVGVNSYPVTGGVWYNDFEAWDLRSVPSGSYYVYARMSDGNYAVTKRSPGRINVIEQPIENNLQIVDVLFEESQGDGDLIPESGEKLTVKLKIKNNSSFQLYDVDGSIISYVPGDAVVREERIVFGDFAPSEIKGFQDYTGDFNFEINPSNYQGAVVFSVRFEYRRPGTSWVQEFDSAYFTINPNGTTAPAYEITAIEIVSDTDGDKIPESGEDVSFRIKVKNVGTAAGIGIKGCFDPISQGYWSDNCESFPDLNPGAEGWSVGTFDIHDLPHGFNGSILTNLIIAYGEDGGFQDIENPYTLAVQPAPYIDLDPQDYNFGVKNPIMGSIDIPFVIRNYGSSNLDISNFTANSPTDTQIIGTYPLTITPGSSASFTARVTISALSGDISPHTITVVSNAHLPANNVFTITGTVASLKPPIQIGSGTKPDVYDNYIVWSNSGAVYIKDIISGSISTVSSSGKTFSGPSINEFSGKHIVVFNETVSDDIWMYTLETGELRSICTAAGEQHDPKIWGRYIIWQDERNGVDEYGGTDLYGFDLETSTEFGIAINERNVFDIAIYNGVAAWHTQVVSGSNTTHSLITKVLPNGTKYTKVLGPSYPTFPGNMTFYGQKVIFDAPDSQYGDDHLWSYDINTHGISKLTSYADDHVNPDAWGCKVVYEDRRDGRDIYIVDVCNPGGENPIAVSSATLSSPAIWEQIVAYSSGGVIYAISLSDVDLSTDFLCPESPALVAQQTTLSGKIYNVGSQAASGIPVKFYDGDPQNGGLQLGVTQLVSVAAGSSISVSMDWVPESVGTRTICILAGASGDFNGLKDCCEIQTLSNDTAPPMISNIKAEEYLGDGDGIIEDDEQVKVSATISDPTGICQVSVVVNGIALQTQGDYFSITGPYAEGVVSFAVNASDCASPANSDSESSSFQVKRQLAIESVSACNQQAWPINAPIEILFNLDLDPLSVVPTNFVLEKTSGGEIQRSVSYQPAFRRVVITPTIFLEEGTEYQLRIISGSNGLKDESGGWFPGTQYQCTFSTDTPSARDTDNDGIPDGWEIRNGFNPFVDEAMGDVDHDGFSNLREYLSGSDPQNENDKPSILADFESDNDVDGKDLSHFIEEYGRTDCDTAPDPCEFDLDTDGDVDVIDMRLLIEDFGRSQN